MNRIRALLTNKELLILNGALVLFLLLIVYYSPFRPSGDLLLFSPDSQTYFNTGKEFFNFSEQGDSIIRPFFYSCLLRSGYFIGGAWLIVTIQSLFWLISANLIYFAIRHISENILYRIVAILLFVLNISLITYVFHGLTEIITVFLLSVIIYLTAQSFKKGFTVSYALKILLLLSVLTVTKPLFQYPLLFSFLFVIVRFSRTFLAQKRLIILLLLIIVPVIIQLTGMKVKYDTFKISAIGELTFDTYLLAQGIRKTEGITDVQFSQDIAQKMSKEEKRNYLYEHRKTFLLLFSKNVRDNITGDGHSFILPPGYTADGYRNFMISYNESLYDVSRFFLFLFLVISAIDLFTSKLFKNWQQLTIGLLLYYIVFSSGISFWQGDRLVIFSLPLWIFLYIILFRRILNSTFTTRFFSKKVHRK